MNRFDLHRTKGQAFIWVTLLMLLLLSFLALAIDVGHLYGNRRQMQNAADAGALAGAYELCFGNPDDVQQTAWEYAMDRNGAHNAVVTRPEWWQVQVVTNKDVNTFLGGLFGSPVVDVEALAVAACGSAVSACGLWPIAFDEEVWDTL